MAQEFHKGDEVTWKTPQGTTKGTVERRTTSPETIKGHQVKASKDNPQYIVESESTGAKAAHKPGALKKA